MLSKLPLLLLALLMAPASAHADQSVLEELIILSRDDILTAVAATRISVTSARLEIIEVQESQAALAEAIAEVQARVDAAECPSLACPPQCPDLTCPPVCPDMTCSCPETDSLSTCLMCPVQEVVESRKCRQLKDGRTKCKVVVFENGFVEAEHE